MNLTKKTYIWLGIALLLLCVISGLLFIFHADTPVLLSEKGATWIYIDRSFAAEAQREGERISYRKSFYVEQVPSAITLTVRALRLSDVYIDGKRLLPVKSSLSRWKGSQLFNLSGLITPGQHIIIIRVVNKNGPAVLLANCKSLNIFSGPGWEASYDELLWTWAVPADRRKTSELSGEFVSTDKAFMSLLPLYGLIFMIVLILTWISTTPGKWADGQVRKIMSSASNIRWLLIVLWGILGINNLFKVPIETGMDAQQHYEYIEYVANLWRIPLAPQGWQMFQSPFYYLISAVIWHYPLSHWFNITTGMLLLRIIPLFCGLLQVELAYRAARYVFPQRQDLQIWGTIIGGLLPMNLYISQVVGNEPLSGLISACAVVIGFIMLTSSREVLPNRYFILLGATLGLSLLTKVTAVLLIPPTVILVIWTLYERQHSLKYIILRVLLVCGIIFVIAGWYYIRNWIKLGRPFVGGWESTTWWQDPGYRTIPDFLAFGRSLTAPIYSSVQGFWDSIYSTLWLDGGLSGIGIYKYRPPWNYDFMLSGTLLSLIPMAGMLIGMAVTIIRISWREYRVQLFSACCIVIYLAALLYLYITIPIFSTAKATYTLGLIPCYAILCVTGLEFLSRNRLLRALINACIVCWAIAAYCSYFVVVQS